MLKEKVSRHAVRNDRKHILAVGGALLLLLNSHLKTVKHLVKATTKAL